MWKSVSVLILALLTINWHLRYQIPTPIPKLSDEYWGPGKEIPDSKEIKPFKIDISKEIIDDLHQRLDRSRSLVPPLKDVGWNYGISTTYLKTILKYWREKYNWKHRQALLNKYPQFKTKIQEDVMLVLKEEEPGAAFNSFRFYGDLTFETVLINVPGLDIHFYRIKPQLPKDRNVRVLPMLLVHGWPGSFVEFFKIAPLLTTPRPDKDYVFELVIPSLPGYAFSSATDKPGLGVAQMAVIMKNLMTRLGFERFYTQGGDWGSIITSIMSILYPKRIIGLHLNMCFIETPRSTFLTLIGAYFPSLILSSEHHSKMYPLSYHLSKLVTETGYMHIQSTKPDTVGVGLTDSPTGLAAYILEKFSSWTNYKNIHKEDGGLLEKFTIDELLDNIMIYWVTNSITTSQRIYAESFNKNFRKLGWNTIPIQVPTGCAMFPDELVYQSETLLSERFTNIIQFTHPLRGGHFAAYEEPELLATDIWSFVHKREQLLFEEENSQKQRSTDV